MSVITVPRILRDKFGDEAMEAFVDVINKNEPSKDYSTKADIANLRTELKTDIIDIGWKQKLYFLILLFVMLLTNPKAIDLLGKLLGIVK
ncbi:MAG: hypothetical protein HQK89_04105 [Nitrospirae bacterium]|nr:hypothetical protein [Nitrospirota bacterium]